MSDDEENVLKVYEYDGLGRRVRELPTGEDAVDLYYSAGWQVLEEHVDDEWYASYVWSSVYVDALILRDRDDERLYSLHDVQFNVVALVDDSGDVVERYVYDAFGAVTVMSPTYTVIGASTVGWVIGFQGMRYDEVSGLSHQRARWYSATLGRWVTTDPILFAAGENNFYRYVGNNPGNWVDPSGLQGVGQPGFGESLLPVWGSGREAIDDFQNGRIGWGVFNTFLAATDVFLVKSIVVAGGKLCCKGASNALTKSTLDELAAKSAIEAGDDIAWKLRPEGTRIKQVGDLWIKEVDPTASGFRRWYGRKSLDAQAEGLGKLGSMAPGFMYKEGKLVLKDVGPIMTKEDFFRDPLKFALNWGKGSQRLGTPFNDIRLRNMGKNGLIFDPAKNPLQVGSEALLGECVLTFVKIGETWYRVENGVASPLNE